MNYRQVFYGLYTKRCSKRILKITYADHVTNEEADMQRLQYIVAEMRFRFQESFKKISIG